MPSLSSSSARQGAAARETLNQERYALPLWAHPDLLYWIADWKLIRDAASGEKDVKAERDAYLPQFDGMDDDEYNSYLAKATYYNFTGRTMEALKGTIFRRSLKVKQLPDPLKDDDLDNVSRSGGSLNIFAKFVGRELLTVGRIGVLVDMPRRETTEPKPYVCAYIAENIVDWDTMTDEQGREVLSRVVLREFTLQKTEFDLSEGIVEAAKAATGPKVQPSAGTLTSGGAPGQRRYKASYRVLTLEPRAPYLKPVYVQRYYSDPKTDADITPAFFQFAAVPMVKGQPFYEIPFQFFGALSGGPAVEKPPMLDIARLNISHFRSYAHLEHGRFYTGFPIYYVEVGQGGEGGGEYEIGPSRVWETPTGAKPGLIEFNGQGLKFLENALLQKEAQAASLGGRMIGVLTQSTTESADALKMKDRNEQSILLDVSQMLDFGFTRVVKWWARMRGVAEEDVGDIEIVFNKDFLLDSAGSREFRAIHAMYKDGLIPVQVLYDYLTAHEVIPDDMEFEDFQKLISDPKNFPNQPDAQARDEGFPNAKAKLDNELAQDQLDLQQEAQDAQVTATRLAHQVAMKQAENPPPAAPGAPPAAPGAPGGGPGGKPPPKSGGKPGPAAAPKPAKTAPGK